MPTSVLTYLPTSSPTVSWALANELAGTHVGSPAGTRATVGPLQCRLACRRRTAVGKRQCNACPDERPDLCAGEQPGPSLTPDTCADICADDLGTRPSTRVPASAPAAGTTSVLAPAPTAPPPAAAAPTAARMAALTTVPAISPTAAPRPHRQPCRHPATSAVSRVPTGLPTVLALLCQRARLHSCPQLYRPLCLQPCPYCADGPTDVTADTSAARAGDECRTGDDCCHHTVPTEGIRSRATSAGLPGDARAEERRPSPPSPRRRWSRRPKG